MGYKFRPAFAKDAKVSLRSLAAVENGEPGVGAANLRAIGRALQGWTRDHDDDIVVLTCCGRVLPLADRPADAEPCETCLRT